MNLELVTVGTELLLGFTVDTNGAELGRACAAVGIRLVRRTAVPDEPAAIRAAVADALARTGFVVTTGGLGPTRDDATKHAVAHLFGRVLVEDADVLRSLETRARRMGRWPMPASNRTQADIPAGATVLPNPRGTAPGLWLEDEQGRVAVLLPGVPHEMRGLLHEEVLPRFVRRVGVARVVRSRTLRTTGIAESALADRLGAFEADLGRLSLAYLPSEAGVDLRLTAWVLPANEADAELGAAAARLATELGPVVYGEEETDLAAVVLDQLRARQATLAVAESCTGGLLGGRLTAVPGASDVFVGGVVAYANAAKAALLGVPDQLLTTHGAVSEPVVRALAAGAAASLHADAALAVTGIAGPTGGTPDKPVGTVWLAARRGETTRVARVVFPGGRDEIRARAAQGALNLLRLLLRES